MFTSSPFSEIPLPICGWAVQSLHCTILLENKQASHAVRREMGRETERDTYLQPGCSDAWFHENGPLFVYSVAAFRYPPSESPCLPLRTATDAGRRESTRDLLAKIIIPVHEASNSRYKKKDYIKRRQLHVLLTNDHQQISDRVLKPMISFKCIARNTHDRTSVSCG